MICARTLPRFFRTLRRPGIALTLAASLAAVTATGGCVSKSDLKKVDEANKVQEQRLRALEKDTLATVAGQKETLTRLEREVQAMQGRLRLITEQNQRLTREQTAMRENQERSLSGQRKMTRMVQAEAAKISKFRLEAENDLDKMRIQLSALEKLLRTPIANLPAKTPADKDFREAHYLLLNGELDLAADRFDAFRKNHPKDARGVESVYRRGQALFLLRKYDHALIPFFEVVEKSPRHKLATPSRWMLARSLEETGDLGLAREFYAQLITGKTAYAADATRRVSFINKLFPQKPGKGKDGSGKP